MMHTKDIRFRRFFLDWDKSGYSHFRVEATIEVSPGVRLTAFSDPVKTALVVDQAVSEANRLIQAIYDAGMQIEGPDLTVEDYYFRSGMA